MPIVEDTHTGSVCNNIQGNCFLENLPPEVRRHILYFLGVEELRALVHASPVFHQQYLLDRRSLLLQSIETISGNITVDAYAVYQSGWADYEDLCTEDEVAWEVEEIACVCTFAKEMYAQIFHEIRWDVHQDNPKYKGQRPPTPPGTFDLDNDCKYFPSFCL